MANETVNVELIIEAGKSAQTLGQVRQSIKDVRAALDEVPIGTEAFNELLEVSRKNREMVKSMRQEYAGLKQVTEVGRILTSSFATATASMSLLAGENEKLNEGLRKTAASLELMMGFKELATAFRAAAIENKGLNASLLTNPYVLIAAAIAAVAVGIYTFVNKSEDATEALKKMNATRLTELTDEINKVKKAGEAELVQLEENVKLLEIQKAGIDAITAAKIKQYNKEIELAKEQAEKLNAQDLELAKNVDLNKERIKYNEQLIKQNEDESWSDKLTELITTNATVGSVIDKWKKLNEQLKDNVETGEKNQKILDDANKTQVKGINDIKNAEAERAQQYKDDAKKLSKEAELKGLEEQKKALENIIATDAHYLEIMKLNGATELEVNAQAIKDNENEQAHIERKLENQKLVIDKINAEKDAHKGNAVALVEINDKYKEQEKAYQELIDMLNKMQQAGEKLNAEQTKLVNDAELKKQAAALDRLKTGYETLVKIEDTRYKAAQAGGATETTLSQIREESFQKEMKYLESELVAVNNSKLTDEEKLKRTDELRNKQAELTAQQKELNAAIAQYNKLHFFTADQQKEIGIAEQYISRVQNTISALGKAATASAQQEADKRIAIYQKENDAEQSALSQRLQLGLVTQQQYDAQKKILDDKLAQEKLDAQKKAFQINKAFQLEQAVVSTALAVVNALDTPIPFPGPLIFAALAGAMGAAEIGTIANTQPPAFATGGIFNDGGSVSGVGTGTSDSINARLSNGESVINARSTQAFAPLLSAINQIGGGVAFKGQPRINNTPAPEAPSSAPEAQSKPQRVYVTEYDISRTQKKVQVIQDRTTF